MALLSLLRELHLLSSFIIGVVGVLGIGWIISRKQSKTEAAGLPPNDFTKESNIPVSVNYFPSQKCNYTCGFYFHTYTSSYVLPIDEAKRGLKLLREAGMRKLNIAGGEPFLYPRRLTELLKFGKEELGLESISIVSNGSKITEKWMRENCQWLDILAVSCDSFNPETNKKIGRGDDGGNVIQLFRIAEWFRDYGIKFKLNTVVNIHNWNEDMSAEIERLGPFRWKVFQCLIVAGENENATRLRDATTFLVTYEQWKTFCDRHKHLPCYVPEDTNAMANSYLLLDEYMCFLDKGEGMMIKSESILKVGVEKAMSQVVWDKGSFLDRGGIYDWGRSDVAKEGGCGGGSNEKLQW
ncbi:radical s-adenosyl methionine domain protein [Fusarium tjaetaba]|uniref:Radical s-adenosyl methionine domain protein n=1 Tax=Fusarium tjaetaba TaxID=1567544 RepID=A0A8H5QNS9_9HYPO|nr:radical s-adenosyl methionine domain protein [Fusarium tjaetaba]KAF5617693.1 radical s-adenosyl methionine domain protein [Fusarium tjaetaba]